MDQKLLARLAKLLYEYEHGHPFPEHYGSLLHVCVRRAEVWLDGGRAGRWDMPLKHPRSAGLS